MKRGDKNPSSADAELFGMVPEEYLDRFGVTAYLKDAVTLLLENRPENPIEFIADYFTNVVQGSGSVIRSFRHIKLTKRNRRAFMDNLVAAYQTLEARKGGIARPCITGTDMVKLVKLLCIDFPDPILNGILETLACRPGGEVDFAEFAGAVRSVLAYGDFLEHVEGMFEAFDDNNSGRIPRSTCNRIIRELADNNATKKRELPSPEQLELIVKNIELGSEDDSISDTSDDHQRDDEIAYGDFLSIVFRTMKFRPGNTR